MWIRLSTRSRSRRPPRRWQCQAFAAACILASSSVNRLKLDETGRNQLRLTFASGNNFNLDALREKVWLTCMRAVHDGLVSLLLRTSPECRVATTPILVGISRESRASPFESFPAFF
ncbi:hypothetical protein VNO77_38909 [Canavalia gladiata]|uniref:Uncharacterized protein n=1 Tax=Canavalia gladiata TaxID=3824 RepID=A0AAN9PXR5_CANGL